MILQIQKQWSILSLDEISTDTYLNIMDQYRPAYHANKYPQLDSHITESEYKEVVDYAFRKGIRRGFEHL